MKTMMNPRAVFGAILLLAGGVVANAANRPPTDKELTGKDGKPLTVLLIRIVTEVDGSPTGPFRHIASVDNVTFGLGGFETGMGVKEIGAKFLSDDTRKEGWTYLLVKPGLHYLAVREPMWKNAFAYSARWKTCPRWRVEIPPGSRVHYAGTLFLPGSGRAMLFGPRQMVEFDSSRLEVRDESVRAAEICRQYLAGLVPLTIRMAVELKPGETMIIETPESAKDRPPAKP